MNRTHLFLTVNTNTSCTAELHLTNSHIVFHIVLHIVFHGFKSRINSKGYHSLVPGLISIFGDGMGPFNKEGSSLPLPLVC